MWWLFLAVTVVCLLAVFGIDGHQSVWFAFAGAAALVTVVPILFFAALMSVEPDPAPVTYDEEEYAAFCGANPGC